VRQHLSSSRSSFSAPDLTPVLFNRDGSARLFLDDQVVAAARPSSYPEPRHLVGISRENAVYDASAAGGVGAAGHTSSTEDAQPAAPFDRARPLPVGQGHKGQESWARERLEWETAFVLRELLAGYDSRLEADCGGEGKVLQHALSDRQRLSPYRCQARAVCPCCGRAYGQGRGLELAELVDAVLQPGRLLTVVPQVKAWHTVLSCDSRVSAYVDHLVVLDDRDQLRRVMRHLTEDVHKTVRAVFGPGAAAVVAWHWWNSADPLSGRHHVHAHVTVPNVSVRLDPDTGAWVPDMRELRRKGKLSSSDLLSLRSTFGAAVASHRWCKALGVTAANWKQNAHVRFTQQREGQGYAHRLRYDGRTSVADLLQLVTPDVLRDAGQLHAGLLGEDELERAAVDVGEVACNDDGLRWWVHAAQVWQGVQTVRYTGWLVNSARKSLGLLKDLGKEDEPEWSSVGLYRVLNAGAEGVQVERWTSAGRQVQQWHADHVQLLPPPSSPSSWIWDETVRPVAKAGPPAAWLAHSGIAKRD